MDQNQPPPTGQTQRQKNLNPQGSSYKGLVGLYESILRRSKRLVHALTILPLYGIAAICLGISAAPGVAIFGWISDSSALASPIFRYGALGTGLALGFFAFGFTLIFVVPFVNFIFRLTPRPFRGPYYSVDVVRWYIHNGLTYLVRYTILDFITPTPFNLLFYRMMGMKIGKDAQINSSNISDPGLIELGDRATIGGSATVLAHYGVGGFLVISPVKIGAGATLGLRAIVMGGVEIGVNAKILPNSVVLPKTKIPAGETWGGIPARKIELKDLRTQN
ncbi:hypothetical protein WDW86_09285 [Bdellovibrionota bacterium FG-2]